MTVHKKVFESAVEALRLVMRFDQPADAILSSYFRQHRALGQHDRAFIAETVFGVLRHARTLEHVAGSAEPRRLALAWLAPTRGVPMDALPPAVRAELPDWVYERLLPVLGESGVLDLGRVLQTPAPLDLRVNTLKTDRESALAALRGSGIAAEPTPWSPLGIRVSDNPAINRHPLFLEGAVEVQDEGSQLIGYLLAPRRHDVVVDFCAGAGGKSLLIGALMHSQGRVYAFDVSAARLARLRPRLKRSGLSNLYPQALASENDTKVKRLAGKIDRVLVDAPCSGLGTLRRNPDLKWRQSPVAVGEMCVKQARILEGAARLVKPGGRLVYATCSLLAEENEAIVDEFLGKSGDFRELSCRDILWQHSVEIEIGQRMRLWPHIHGTDGFFGAVFERSK